MKLAVVYTRACVGIQAPLVIVEVHIVKGLPGFTIVGLPEAAVKESKERVSSAIINSGYELPIKKIIINLAPADLPKEGGRFDLPIAIGILVASGQLPITYLHQYEFAGELALSGDLRKFRGVLPLALGARQAKRKLVISQDNEEEAALPGDNIVLSASSLVSVCEHLKGIQKITPFILNASYRDVATQKLELADIQGQAHAKRALEIAAAGRHNLLLMGPPGTGKTMLASRLPGIMPNLSLDEALEVSVIYSICDTLQKRENFFQRPLRAPHHTASAVSMIGGGSDPKPGEVSLAHHGVLFLDELPEFDRKVLEVLREPLESGNILISRAKKKILFPAKFQLIAAMNPCPCGQLGNMMGNCVCSFEKISRYQSRISMPLLERIDMHIEMPLLPTELLLKTDTKANESSIQVQKRVLQAIQRQKSRANKYNSMLSNEEIKTMSQIDAAAMKLLKQASEKLGLSGRSFYRILKLAQTIADLAQEVCIHSNHISEAIALRRLDLLQRRQPAT